MGEVGHNHHFVFSQKTAGHSRLFEQGHCHGARTNPHSATFLDVFVTGSHAILSTHSSKPADLLFLLEEQTPCALAHQHKKKRN